MDYRAGMFIYALAFLLGTVLVQQLSVLPSPGQLLLLLSVIISLCVFIKIFSNQLRFKLKRQNTLIIYFILLFLLGFTVTSMYANQQLSYRLDSDFIGKNLLVSGYVSNVPIVNGHVQRFEFRVESYRVVGAGTSNDQHKQQPRQFPRNIRLSWYYGTPVNAAEKWQLEVRLKPPHGFFNPGGFDYEAWLFQHRLHATGYVRKSALNKVQTTAVDTSLQVRVNVIRQKLGRQIDAVANRYDPGGTGSLALIKALAFGDKSSISKQQWRVLTQTGTSHLMAISGLHIGLAAFFAYFVIRRSVPALLLQRLPAQHIAVSGGLIVAFLYALIAGLSIPTQRALIMLSVLSVMVLIRRNHRPLDALGFAIFLVLLVDPLAVLSIGFWFSFSAVAVIFISLSSVDTDTLQKDASFLVKVRVRGALLIKQWIRLQLLISLFLMPLSLFMFQQVSLVSPLANLLLIPYVSFLVVPVVLIAVTFSFISPAVSSVLFHLSASILDLVWPLLSYLSALPYALWVQGNVGVASLLSATTALSLFYFSRQISTAFSRKYLNGQYSVYARSLLMTLAISMFITVFISNASKLKPGEYKITVLDVGQGSAAVLQTANHVFVFDAGARFSDKLDAGSSVVIPYLRSQGIRVIDRLIISHGDNDHIGGAEAILDTFPVSALIGQQIADLKANNKQSCYQGLKWQWDAVYFQFLSPVKDDVTDPSDVNRNNQSCVLRVSSKSGSVLFTGDIEKEAEMKLLEGYSGLLRSDILIVPHHGSKTSSSADFVAFVGAEISLISVGYMNRYKLPNDKIIARYVAQNSNILRTDRSGAITVHLSEDNGLLIERYREKSRKYWHHVID